MTARPTQELESVLLLSNGPFSGVGYGVQIGILARQLQAHGYRVAIQCFYGLNGASINWDGIQVFPASSQSRNHLFGLDLTPHYMAEFGADLLLTLTDAWVFNPLLLTKFHVAHWMPVDSAKLGDPDITTLRASGAIPVAMTRFGQGVLQEGGYPALYAPHGIDTDLFSPPEDRNELRRSVGIDDDEFVVISANANMDLYRKNWPGNMAGFAKFHARHPKSRLLCHTPDDGRPQGLNLARWARRLGIFDAVEFCDDERQRAGEYTQEYLAKVFYAVGDAYLGSTRAEGFGLTLVEAAACGVPTIATNFGAQIETGGAGVLVDGMPFESPLHTDWWVTPDEDGIDQALEFYWQMREQGEYPKLRDRARAHARHYDHRVVFERDWVPTLQAIEQRIQVPTMAQQVKVYEDSLTEYMAASDAMWEAYEGDDSIAAQAARDKAYSAWSEWQRAKPAKRSADRDDIVEGPDQTEPREQPVITG